MSAHLTARDVFADARRRSELLAEGYAPMEVDRVMDMKARIRAGQVDTPKLMDSALDVMLDREALLEEACTLDASTSQISDVEAELLMENLQCETDC